MSRREDDLAYGGYHSGGSRGSGGKEGDRDRGFLGDTFKLLKDTYKSQQHSQGQHGGQGGQQGQQQYSSSSSSYYQQSSSNPPYQEQGVPYQQQGVPYQQQGGGPGRPEGSHHYQQGGAGGKVKPDKLTGFLDKIQDSVAGIGTEFAERLGTAIDPQGYAQYGVPPSRVEGPQRFGSFAPPREHNDVKWYVDGCSYFFAVSKALENARESIWILDWWLSPELYLRRPPAKNEQYRVDRLLQAAAQRGVKVNIIVYKEVTQALTLSSAHTKHTLEALHPNIAVFRHPDHLPDGQDLTESVRASFQNLVLDAAGISKLSGDALKGLYGVSDDVILYWAHHEKLCLVDGRVAFMGGLDMCYGRWDTNQHAIADLHPTDVKETVFPGQDYNNARVLDFQDVAHWENNELDRKLTPRMGWSDVSVSLHGVVVEDLRRHFVERWNFIYDTKYQARNDRRYSKLALYGRPTSHHSQQGPPGPQNPQQQQSAPSPQPQYGQSPAPQYQQSQQSPQPQYGQTPAPQYQQPQQSPQPQYGQQPPAQQYQQTQQPPQPQYGLPTAQQPYQQSQAPPQPQYQQQQPAQPYQTQSSPQPQYQQSPAPPQPQYQQSQQPQYQQQPPVSSPGQSSGTQHPPTSQGGYTYTGQSFPPPPPATSTSPAAQAPYFSPPPGSSTSPASQAPYFPPPPTQGGPQGGSQTRGLDFEGEGDGERGFGDTERGFSKDKLSAYSNVVRGQLAGQIHRYQDRFNTSVTQYGHSGSHSQPPPRGHMTCQIVRSCSKWSHGVPTEHSVQNAYAEIIRNSEHFVYIENQFFITATSDAQKPVQNRIGSAIVERILRAARAGQKYKIIVVIPSVPAFAGDLRDDSTLGTRAIMEFQYNSINRGGNSIMELIAKEGYNPMEYIRFYNLRNYDRINLSGPLLAAQQASGVGYEDARKTHDAGLTGHGGRPAYSAFDTTAAYQQGAYRAAGGKPSAGPGRWDSVSECYMLNGPDIRNVPWEGPPEAEINAFVSEELYVHTKVLIADDRTVICGSANLNDRSQLGTHDSEIAIIIEDHTPVRSTMNGQPWTASRFGASLRRELAQKHLGLLPPQDYQRPDQNWEPVGVPNRFDFESPESQVVADPLADVFQNLWNSRAHTNSEVYRKVFHAVPDDTVRNWDAYKEFFEYYFRKANSAAAGEHEVLRPARYNWGHVVQDDFPPGPEGVRQVKELLSQVKGTLVEMPLMFLIEEDVAKEGLTLNDLTEPIYT